MRREKFTSVVQPETFTKTNTLSQTKESSRTQNRISSIKENTKLPLPSRSGLGRFALHSSFIALIVISVSAGKVSSQSSLVSADVSSRNDRTSLITTAAVLSEGSSSMLSSDVSQKAKDLNAQTTLATAGDDFLAKKQPVVSAGAPSRDILSYTVKDGDTISSLSVKFNITSDTIMWANDITNENSIKPGAKLTILPVSGILFTGTGGDDIGELASRFQSNAALIDSFNSLDGKSPLEGQNIVLPDGVKPVVSAPISQIAATYSAKSSPAISYSLRASAGNNYAYGYCTWYVANRRYVASSLGNANQWPYSAPRAGMTVSKDALAGSAGVAKSGNHVVYIERVEGGTVYYSDMNGAAGWNRVGSGSAPASNFIYVY